MKKIFLTSILFASCFGFMQNTEAGYSYEQLMANDGKLARDLSVRNTPVFIAELLDGNLTQDQIVNVLRSLFERNNKFVIIMNNDARDSFYSLLGRLDGSSIVALGEGFIAQLFYTSTQEFMGLLTSINDNDAIANIFRMQLGNGHSFLSEMSSYFNTAGMHNQLRIIQNLLNRFDNRADLLSILNSNRYNRRLWGIFKSFFDNKNITCVKIGPLEYQYI